MNQRRPSIFIPSLLVALTAAAILLGPGGASAATPQGKVVVEAGPPAVTICLGDTKRYVAYTSVDPFSFGLPIPWEGVAVSVTFTDIGKQIFFSTLPSTGLASVSWRYKPTKEGNLPIKVEASLPPLLDANPLTLQVKVTKECTWELILDYNERVQVGPPDAGAIGEGTMRFRILIKSDAKDNIVPTQGEAEYTAKMTLIGELAARCTPVVPIRAGASTVQVSGTVNRTTGKLLVRLAIDPIPRGKQSFIQCPTPVGPQEVLLFGTGTDIDIVASDLSRADGMPVQELPIDGACLACLTAPRHTIFYIDPTSEFMQLPLVKSEAFLLYWAKPLTR